MNKYNEYRKSYPDKTDAEIIEAIGNELSQKVETIVLFWKNLPYVWNSNLLSCPLLKQLRLQYVEHQHEI